MYINFRFYIVNYYICYILYVLYHYYIIDSYCTLNAMYSMYGTLHDKYYVIKYLDILNIMLYVYSI